MPLKASKIKDLIKNKQFELAMQQLENADTLDLYLLRGDLKYEMEDYEGAEKDFTKALELDSQNLKAYNNRGNCRGNLGLYEDAINDYNRANR